MKLPIETERLTVRRFVRDDIPDIQAFASHPSVAREITNIPHENPDQLANYIEEQNGLELFAAKKCIDLAIERKADGRVLGLLSIVSNGERQAEIGWGLGIEYRGNGYVTEAARALITTLFATREYHRVFAGTIFTNKRSWAVMERLGMRKEAHFRKAHVPPAPGEEWIDTVRYAVLAEEWPPTTAARAGEVPMRRKDREITDRAEIDSILKKARVCRVAFSIQNEPYIIPLSHGYDAQAKALFFHTAKEGKKIDCIEANPRVCFEVEGRIEVKRGDERACSWSMHYESVIGHGVIVEVTSPDDREHALRCLTEQQAGQEMDWTFEDKAMAATRVWRLDIVSITGKRAFPPQSG